MPDDELNEFSQHCHNERTKLGHTVTELAEIIGCNQSMVSNIENGKLPSLKMIKTFCEFFNYPYTKAATVKIRKQAEERVRKANSLR